ncbi:hypothetical protein HDU99_007078 [Rhizoclosmatium hyalinum]|nr:hypothetical protein HDU99_007078 [Rhizoclosmatium hyalinum]
MHIRPLSQEDEDAAAHSLIVAFSDEPIGSFIYPDASAREAGDKKFFTDLIKNRDPLKIKVDVTDDIGAVAVWEHKSTDLTKDAAYPSIEGIKPEAEQLFALVDKNLLLELLRREQELDRLRFVMDLNKQNQVKE